MAKGSYRLELVFADFDPLVCTAAQRSFNTVLDAHPGAPVRVKVVQGDMLAAIAGVRHAKAVGYDEYLSNVGYSQHQRDEFLRNGSGRCREPRLWWDSVSGGRRCVASSDDAAGSSGSGSILSQGARCSQPYSPPTDTARTFLVYGANSAGVACGNAQKSVSEVFPTQFQDVHAQIIHEQKGDADSDCWPLDTQGRIYASSSGSETNDGVSILAAVVFPRAHDEYGNTRDVFTNALRAAISSGAYAKGCTDDHTVRVVTHALGTFTGHHDPPQFATSMADGLDHFLKNDML